MQKKNNLEITNEGYGSIFSSLVIEMPFLICDRLNISVSLKSLENTTEEELERIKRENNIEQVQKLCLNVYHEIIGVLIASRGSHIIGSFNSWLVKHFSKNGQYDESIISAKFITSIIQRRERGEIFKVVLGDETAIYGRVISKCISTSDRTIKFITSTGDAKFLPKLINYYTNELGDIGICSKHVSEARKLVNIKIQNCPEISIKKIKNTTNSLEDYSLYYIPHQDIFIANEKLKPLTNFHDSFNEPEYPAWFSFLRTFSTVEEAELFLAFLYSIAYAKNTGRQLVWLRGIGGSAKSRVSSEILSYFSTRYGDKFAFAFTDIMANIDKYASVGINLARFILIPDVEKQDIMNLPYIRQATGGDQCLVRSMYNEGKTGQMYCKIMVTSNYPPLINIHAEHETSRLLYLTISTEKSKRAKLEWNKKKYKDSFEDMIYQELPELIKHSRQYYEKYVDDNGNFIISERLKRKTFDECAEPVAKQISAFFDLYMIPEQNAKPLTIEAYVSHVKSFLDCKIDDASLRQKVSAHLDIKNVVLEKIQTGDVSYSVIKFYRLKSPRITFKQYIQGAKERSN